MNLGIKRATSKIVAYSATWPKEYEPEKLLLLNIFGNTCLAMEHIGLTKQ